jgi:hypothetical protein
MASKAAVRAGERYPSSARTPQLTGHFAINGPHALVVVGSSSRAFMSGSLGGGLPDPAAAGAAATRRHSVAGQANHCLPRGLLRWLRRRPSGETSDMRTRRPRPMPVPRSAFASFRFPPDVIVLAVRWYLRFGLSYRDVEELLVERGIEVDHVTVYRWVQRFTPLLAEAARPCRHRVGDRWQVDETT